MRLWRHDRKKLRRTACQRKRLREEGRPVPLLVSIRRHRACDGLDVVQPAIGRDQAVENEVSNAKRFWRAFLQRSRSLLAGQPDIAAGTSARRGEGGVGGGAGARKAERPRVHLPHRLVRVVDIDCLNRIDKHHPQPVAHLDRCPPVDQAGERRLAEDRRPDIGIVGDLTDAIGGQVGDARVCDAAGHSV